LLAIAVILIGVLAGCMDASLAQPESSGSVQTSLSLQTVPVGIEQITVTVSGPGMEDIEETVDVTTATETGITIEVPLGPDRVFTASAGDWSARRTQDVVGEAATVTLSFALPDEPLSNTKAFAADWDGDHEIYSVAAGSSSGPVKLTDNNVDDHVLRFAPDGSRIVFTQGTEGFDIYAMDPDGSNQTRLTETTIFSYPPLGFSRRK